MENYLENGLSYPICETCNRKDETLQIKKIPYVISLIIITSRKAFTGVWCRRHYNANWLAATFLTSAFGWWGVPFGVLLTPYTLVRLFFLHLAQPDDNAQLLVNLADKKLEYDDTSSAVKCLEHSLKYRSDPEVVERLRALNPFTQKTTRSTRPLWRRGIELILFAFTLGIIMGVIALGLLYDFGNFLAGGWAELSYIAFLLPVVVLFSMSIVALIQFSQYQLGSERFTNPLFYLSVSIFSSLFLIYGWLEGKAIFELLHSLWQGYKIAPFEQILPALVALITRGGYVEFLYFLQSQFIQDTVILATVLGLGLLAMAAIISFAIQHIRWQKRLEAVYRRDPFEEQPTGLREGLIAQLGLVSCFLIAGWLVPQQSAVDFLEAKYLFYDANDLTWEEDWESAILRYEESAALNPDFYPVNEALSDMFLRLGDYERSLPYAKKAAEVSPLNAYGQAMLGYDYLFISEPDFTLARQHLERALEISPEEALAQSGLGLIALYDGELEVARNFLLKAVEYDPEDADSYLWLVVVYSYLGDRDAALSTLDKIQRMNIESLYFDQQVGMFYVDFYQYDLAEPLLRKVVEAYPEDEVTLEYYYISQYRQGNFEEALQTLYMAIEQHPESALFHADTAFVLMQLGQTDESAVEEEKARQSPLKDTSTLLTLSNVSYLNRNIEQVKADLQQAILVDSGDNPYLYQKLAYSHCMLEEYDQAIEACAQIGEDDPFLQSIYYHCMGNVYLSSNRYDQALSAYNRALQADPVYPHLDEDLGMLYIKQGEYDKALEAAGESRGINGYSYNNSMVFALSHLYQGDYYNARLYARRMLFLYPMGELAHFILGSSLISEGDTEAGIEELGLFLQKAIDRPFIRPFVQEAEQLLEDYQ